MNYTDYKEEEHPVTLALAAPTPEPFIFKCPPGRAYGASEQLFHTHTGDELVTVWPSSRMFNGLNMGRGLPPYNIDRNPTRLWHQEYYVWLAERRHCLIEQLEELIKTNPLPRKPGSNINDTAPYAEDFGMDFPEHPIEQPPKSAYGYIYDGVRCTERMPVALQHRQQHDVAGNLLQERKVWIEAHRMKVTPYKKRAPKQPESIATQMRLCRYDGMWVDSPMPQELRKVLDDGVAALRRKWLEEHRVNQTDIRK
jgi:hypothetical protein